jgi:hypothetical protein
LVRRCDRFLVQSRGDPEQFRGTNPIVSLSPPKPGTRAIADQAPNAGEDPANDGQPAAVVGAVREARSERVRDPVGYGPEAEGVSSTAPERLDGRRVVP